MKYINFKTVVLTLFMSGISLESMAYDVKIDGIYYNLSGTNAIVTSGDSKYTGSIVIPASFEYDSKTYIVTSIGRAAFSTCYSLTSVVIPDGVTSIEQDAFYCCTHLTSVNIPDKVTTIGERAFEDCSLLTSILVPNNVSTIGMRAFYNCSGITSISIPKGVQVIGQRTFYGCSNLTSITIPNSVKTIGKYAFYGCSRLSSVFIFAAYATLSENNSFDANAYGRKIYVLNECVNWYKDAINWSANNGSIEVIPNPEALTTTSVNDANWATYYNDDANVQVDESTTVYKTELSESTITLTDTGSKIIKAGEAVVLNTSSNQISLTYTAVPNTVDYDNNALEGSNNEVTQESDYTYYALANLTQGLGFYKVDSGLNIPANKGYIKVANSSAARDFLGIDGMMTSIDKTLKSPADNHTYYDLSGRRVKSPTKGLYIVNGKKVVIK